MKITLSPVASDRDSKISANDDTISIDGAEHDFSSLGKDEHAFPEEEPAFVGAVTREDGKICCTVVYRYDSRSAHPVQSAHPEDYVFDIQNGAVPDPILRHGKTSPMP